MSYLNENARPAFISSPYQNECDVIQIRRTTHEKQPGCLSLRTPFIFKLFADFVGFNEVLLCSSVFWLSSVCCCCCRRYSFYFIRIYIAAVFSISTAIFCVFCYPDNEMDSPIPKQTNDFGPIWIHASYIQHFVHPGQISFL